MRASPTDACTFRITRKEGGAVGVLVDWKEEKECPEAATNCSGAGDGRYARNQSCTL